MQSKFRGPDQATQALIDLRIFASSSGGTYIAQAGTAYGSHCAQNKRHTTMRIESVHQGHDGLGRPRYVPVAKCRTCGARWPRVEANILRAHIGGRSSGTDREELLFLKARLEAAWSEIPERVQKLRAAKDPTIGQEAQESYLWFILGVSGGWPGLAAWMRERTGAAGWTEWRARRGVMDARRALGDALADRALLFGSRV